MWNPLLMKLLLQMQAGRPQVPGNVPGPTWPSRGPMQGNVGPGQAKIPQIPQRQMAHGSSPAPMNLAQTRQTAQTTPQDIGRYLIPRGRF